MLAAGATFQSKILQGVALDQAGRDQGFSPIIGTVQLTKGHLHFNHPLSHMKHISPFLTDAPLRADGDKPRAHLTGKPPCCVLRETMGQNPEISFSSLAKFILVA